MASETQYYQAKVFLKAYSEALQTLDDVHSSQALLAKNLALKEFVVGGHNRGEISIKNGGVVRQKNFDNSRIRTIGAFSASNFAKDLTKFDSASSFGSLIKLLEEKVE